MTVHQVIVETIHLAGRQLNNRALGGTQTTTSTGPTQTAAATSSAATPTSTMAGNNGGTSSPLLFFVALGFGVVFTNLWIIVGVKYCFRYNARNRAIRNGEEVDPITLDAMPARPHRRRREKKLMTMEEVNERFPLTKYKAWVASRASEGLPTTGGVTVPPSRAASLRGADGALPLSPDDSKHAATVATTTVQTPSGSSVVNSEEKHVDTTVVAEASEEHNALKQVQTTASTLHKDKDAAAGSDDEDEEDDHIHTAVPPELLTNPGDSCAICIDTLEEDDDIRGLTCGHAFHASCLDPWLTSRRACCPLCKADYFTPKPRPENPEVIPRARLPQPPASAWGIRGNTRLMLPGRFMSSVPGDGNDIGAAQRQARGARAAGAATPATGTRRWAPRNPFRNIHVPGRATSTAAPAIGVEPSPSQLEAGTAR